KFLKNNWGEIGAVVFLFFLWYSLRTTEMSGGYWEKLIMTYLGYSYKTAHAMVFVIRKTGHFLMYGIFALCLKKIWSRHFSKKRLWSNISALIIAGGVAFIDEWLQSLTPLRTGLYTDVLIDLSGIIVF